MSIVAQQLAEHVRSARYLGIASRRRAVPDARPPTLIESDYAARLVAIVDRMRTAARHVLDGLPGLLRTDANVRLDDDPGRRARRKMDRVRAEVGATTNDTQLEGVAHEMATRVSTHQKGELVRQGRAALGIDVVTQDRKVAPLISGFVHENVSLIKSLQGRVLDDLENMVIRAVTSGTRADAVQQQLADRFGVAERHARLIARDQIGKLHSQIARSRHEELGIRSYDWQHIGNKNPRPHHVARHGQRFAYDKPPADGNPGMAICCHCLAKPVFDDIHLELGMPVSKQAAREDYNPNHDQAGRFSATGTHGAEHTNKRLADRAVDVAHGARLHGYGEEAAHALAGARVAELRTQIEGEHVAMAAGHVLPLPAAAQAAPGKYEDDQRVISARVTAAHEALGVAHRDAIEAINALEAYRHEGNDLHPGNDHIATDLAQLHEHMTATSDALGELHHGVAEPYATESEHAPIAHPEPPVQPEREHWESEAEHAFQLSEHAGELAAYHREADAHAAAFRERAVKAQESLERLQAHQKQTAADLKRSDKEQDRAENALRSHAEKLDDHDLVNEKVFAHKESDLNAAGEHHDPAVRLAEERAGDASTAIVEHYRDHVEALIESHHVDYEDAHLVLAEEIHETRQVLRELKSFVASRPSADL